MDKEMNEWNIEWMDDDDSINGWKDKEMNEWNIEWIDGWIRKWMNEILNEWMMVTE